MKPQSISERQPHIVTNYNGDCHVIPLTMIRDIRNGTFNADQTTAKIMAQIILDLADDKD